ncbi:MAG: Ig-like domain-containing protein [Acutalibacteraceae bacterium]|nr:Ig-like domain-containing protein [Acutalibacteraceae bacterium]
MEKAFRLLFTLIIAIITAVMAFSFSSSAADEKWVCAWGTAPTKIGIDGYQNINAYVGDVTARVVITPTASGKKLRIKMSNRYGKEPLVLTRVTIAKSLGGSKIDTATTKIITFNEGYQGINLAPGEEIYSDPVVFPVTATQDKVAISFFAEQFTEISTMGLSGAESFLAIGGDKTSDATFGFASVMENQQILDLISKLLGTDLDLKLGYSIVNVVPCIASLDVLTEPDNGYSVVVMGDSTVANEFPLYLAQAINKAGVTNVGVVGKGIIGNSLLSDGLGLGSEIFGISMLSRFDADALSQSGVKYVIVKIGANDIMHPVCVDNIGKAEQPTANDIIEGYRKVFKKCHDAGIKVIAVSITQWKGSTRNYFGSGDQYVRTAEEFQQDWKIAQDVNKWLKKTTEHDGYVDFVSLSSNPKDPDAFLPEYTIDGIHPSDSLQKVWGGSFPLSLIGIGNSVNKLTLSAESATIYTGKTKQLTATVYPKTALDKSVKWYSSDSKVATVDEKGLVTGVSNGTAVITCKTNDGGITESCTVTVKTAVSSVSLNKTEASVYVTKSLQLKATVKPSTASDKAVTWKSSNEKVATVNEKGKVYGVGSGTATITCKTNNGGKTATCVITVLKKTEVMSVSLTKTYTTTYKGRTYQFKAKVGPENATFPELKWTSSDTKVAKVDSNGLVTAVGKGKAVITCSSVDNPMIRDSHTVKVYVYPTGVKLNTKSTSVYEGKTKQLTATVSPADASNKNVKWTSSDTKIATVSSTGLVKAKKPGTVYITCTTERGGFTARCKIKVLDFVSVKSVKLNKTSLTIDDSKTYKFTATVSPSNASEKGLKWKSSDPKTVYVNSKGVIEAMKPGKATITCTTVDGAKTAKCVVTVKKVVPTKVTLNKKSVNIGYNKTYQLKATVSPSYATDKSVKWKSSDSSIVYVNSKGVVQGMKPGKSAVITCTTVSGKKIAQCTVKVNPVKVKSIKLSKSEVTLGKGSTLTLKPTISPSNATNKSVVWRSSNTSVATVSSKGVVKGTGNGKAVITCTTNDGSFTAKCTVTVKSVKVLGVTLNKTQVVAAKGSTFTLKATVVPANATNKAVTWTSSDNSVAKVSTDGRVTAVGKGTCEIKVYTKDGNYIALCRVIVQ